MESENSGLVERFSRQTRFTGLGEGSLERLRQASVVIVGCGALGSVVAELLVRSGVGRVVLIDPDIVQIHNLPRQFLYDEDDAAESRSKAEAAVRRLERISSITNLTPLVERLDHSNAHRLLAGADIILDGTDNLETRYIMNESALSLGIPWIYAGVAAATGMSMLMLPGKGPCFRCLFPAQPPPESVLTAENAGVIGPAVTVAGSIEAAIAMHHLAGAGSPPAGVPKPGELVSFDLWTLSFATLAVEPVPGCPVCSARDSADGRERKPA